MKQYIEQQKREGKTMEEARNNWQEELELINKM